MSLESLQLCTFRLCGRLYGVNILDVKEVTTEVNSTPIYHSPEEVSGYVNMRGHVHLVLDMRLLLGMETKDPDELSKIILFKPHVGESFGILVDSIGDVLNVNQEQIEDRRNKKEGPPDGIERRKINLGIGVCRLLDELLVILDAYSFLRAIS